MHFPVQCESRNFKTRGRGPGSVEFLGSEVCFDAFIHTLCFVVREENKGKYCKHCMMAAITVYACYTVKIYKYKPPKKFQIWGWAPGTPVLDPPLLVTLGNRDTKLNVSTEGIPFLPKSMKRILSEKKGQCHHYRLITNWPLTYHSDQ